LADRRYALADSQTPVSDDIPAHFVIQPHHGVREGQLQEEETDAEGLDETKVARSFSAQIERLDSGTPLSRKDEQDTTPREKDATDDAEGQAKTEDPIELPTSLEPKAQRSPWAWAAPPEWNRDDEEDLPPSGSSSSS
ncbi:MAG: hypothetical protein ACC726_12920, partial [Chloroflexota bacterium]